MHLKKEFIDKMLKCSWLHMCGEKDALPFDVEYLDSKKVEKSINSTKWENMCLDRMGDFTAYLTKNHKDEYKKYWNEEVKYIKANYIPSISENINKVLLEKELPLDILDDMKMNIVSLFMLEFYSDYYSCDFYEKMQEIYLAGHLPCGWVGEYPNGKFLVY